MSAVPLPALSRLAISASMGARSRRWPSLWTRAPMRLLAGRALQFHPEVVRPAAKVLRPDLGAHGVRDVSRCRCARPRFLVDPSGRCPAASGRGRRRTGPCSRAWRPHCHRHRRPASPDRARTRPLSARSTAVFRCDLEQTAQSATWPTRHVRDERPILQIHARDEASAPCVCRSRVVGAGLPRGRSPVNDHRRREARRVAASRGSSERRSRGPEVSLCGRAIADRPSSRWRRS